MEPINRRPVMDVQRKRPPAPVAPRAAVAPAPAAMPIEPAAAPVNTAPAPVHLPKNKAPWFAILVAVIISGGLITLSVFGYLKTKDGKKGATPPVASVEKVTTSDVETSLSDTDAQLQKLNDASDYNAADLTDDNLGL